MSQESPQATEQQKRFVILRHYFSAGGNGEFFDHFDLMLEQNSKLATWQLEELPSPDKGVVAKKLPDHRVVYLDYEGPVSGGRGSVEQVMAGIYEICEKNDSCLEVLLTSKGQLLRLKIVSGSSGTVTVSVLPTV